MTRSGIAALLIVQNAASGLGYSQSYNQARIRWEKVTEQSASYEVWYLGPSRQTVANVCCFWTPVSFFICTGLSLSPPGS